MKCRLQVSSPQNDDVFISLAILQCKHMQSVNTDNNNSLTKLKDDGKNPSFLLLIKTGTPVAFTNCISSVAAVTSLSAHHSTWPAILMPTHTWVTLSHRGGLFLLPADVWGQLLTVHIHQKTNSHYFS